MRINKRKPSKRLPRLTRGQNSDAIIKAEMYKIITPHELLIRLLPSTYAVHVVAGLTGAMCVERRPGRCQRALPGHFLLLRKNALDIRSRTYARSLLAGHFEPVGLHLTRRSRPIRNHLRL